MLWRNLFTFIQLHICFLYIRELSSWKTPEMLALSAWENKKLISVKLISTNKFDFTKFSKIKMFGLGRMSYLGSLRARKVRELLGGEVKPDRYTRLISYVCSFTVLLKTSTLLFIQLGHPFFSLVLHSSIIYWALTFIKHYFGHSVT